MNVLNLKLKTQNRPPVARKKRGQTMVELSLTLPILMILMSIVVEGGLALNAWLRVNTAARDATRFALDSGRPVDTASLVNQKLQGVDFGSGGSSTPSSKVDVFIVTARTNGSGQITNWTVAHQYDGNSDNNSIRLQQSTIQARLDSQGLNASQNVNLILVEVDYVYTPIIGTLLASGASIPMTSYAMAQKLQ